MTEEDVPNTTFLKWVVGVLGIMIVGVAAAIGIILYKRAMSGAEQPVPEASAPEVLGIAPSTQFGNVSVKLPEGMSVLGINPEGALVYVTYGKTGEAPTGIIVLNGGSGAQMGQFVFER